jgi:hypothetical protein
VDKLKLERHIECKEEYKNNWSKDRYIFISNDQLYIHFLTSSLLILINMEDHLKFVSRVMDNDLTKAYARLMEVHNQICNKLKYALDSISGFLVSSLDEIGEGGFGIELQTTNRFTVRSKYGESVKETINRSDELAKTNT